MHKHGKYEEGGFGSHTSKRKNLKNQKGEKSALSSDANFMAGIRTGVSPFSLGNINIISIFSAGFYHYMQFFDSAISTLQTLVIALGAGLAVWGVINLLEGYGNDNPGAKSQGMKQLMAGAGVALVGIMLIPLLSGLFA
jgi:hypothetical protein